MYPDRVLVRRVVDTTGPQGGVTPAPDVGVWYMASIQPKAQASLKANPETPLAKVDAVCYIPRDPADTLIPNLVYGDQIESGTSPPVVYTVQAPATGQEDPSVVFEIPLNAVQG
jgi:hypothetical protein